MSKSPQGTFKCQRCVWNAFWNRDNQFSQITLEKCNTLNLYSFCTFQIHKMDIVFTSFLHHFKSFCCMHCKKYDSCPCVRNKRRLQTAAGLRVIQQTVCLSEGWRLDCVCRDSSSSSSRATFEWEWSKSILLVESENVLHECLKTLQRWRKLGEYWPMYNSSLLWKRKFGMCGNLGCMSR